MHVPPPPGPPRAAGAPLWFLQYLNPLRGLRVNASSGWSEVVQDDDVDPDGIGEAPGLPGALRGSSMWVRESGGGGRGRAATYLALAHTSTPHAFSPRVQNISVYHSHLLRMRAAADGGPPWRLTHISRRLAFPTRRHRRSAHRISYPTTLLKDGAGGFIVAMARAALCAPTLSRCRPLLALRSSAPPSRAGR